MKETPKQSGTISGGTADCSCVEAGFAEAKAAVAASDAVRKDYDRWFAAGRARLQREGALSCGRDGLIVTMRVGQAALDSAAKLSEILRAAEAHENQWRLALDASGNADGMARRLAESERCVANLKQMLCTEHARFEEVMGVWDTIAITFADMYGLCPSSLWQTEHYTPPDYFADDDSWAQLLEDGDG
jgi:hypothetical protein